MELHANTIWRYPYGWHNMFDSLGARDSLILMPDFGKFSK